MTLSALRVATPTANAGEVVHLEKVQKHMDAILKLMDERAKIR